VDFESSSFPVAISRVVVNCPIFVLMGQIFAVKSRLDDTLHKEVETDEKRTLISTSAKSRFEMPRKRLKRGVKAFGLRNLRLNICHDIPVEYTSGYDTVSHSSLGLYSLLEIMFTTLVIPDIAPPPRSYFTSLVRVYRSLKMRSARLTFPAKSIAPLAVTAIPPGRYRLISRPCAGSRSTISPDD
jgi:hypothetical protein